MRTRTFIGLIFLVLALLVAATPQLLDPTARRIEKLSVSAGLLPDVEKELAKQKANDASQSTEEVTNSLRLKGYELQESGDMLDTVSANRREFGGNGRLAGGRGRAALPGQLGYSERSTAPLVSGDGMLLDTGSCPVFRNDAEIARILEDKATMQTYVDRAGDADDPAGCTKQVRAELTRVDDLRLRLPGDRRRLASSIRGDSNRVLFDYYRSGIVGLLFDNTDADALADDTREALRTTG